MTALKPRKQTYLQLDARRTALRKTLWRVNHPRSRPDRHPPFNTLGLAVQQAIAENA